MSTAVETLFRNDELASFLTTINERYTVTSLAAWDGGPAIILRHDVDLDLRPAHRLAALEQRCGVQSTFFVLTTCPLYNVLAAPARLLLAEMVAWGFEVGLHFDPTVYGDAPDEVLRDHVDRESAILAQATGAPVESVSLHNPSLHGRYPLFDGYHNAYDPRIFASDRYLTDSHRTFDRDPRVFVEQASEHAVQLVLHPLHFTDDGVTYDAIMGRYVLETIDAVEANFSVNDTYRRVVDRGLRRAVREQIDREVGGTWSTP